MKLEMIRENADGSADYNFDLTEDEKGLMIRLGIIKALEMAIEDAQKYVAPEPTDEELAKMNAGGTD